MKTLFLIAFLPFCFLLSAQQIAGDPIRLLALGDSYTIGQSVPHSGSWPYQLADSLENNYGVSVEEVKVVATTGWRTDNLKMATSNAELDSTYDLVGLLIGVNNQFQNKPIAQYYEEFPELLDWAIALASGDTNKVFVYSIPDYAYTPFGNGNTNISVALDVYNRINDSITRNRGVAYYDITPISRTGLDNPNMVASDNLHPSSEQYGLWVYELLNGLEFTQALGVGDSSSMSNIGNLERVGDTYRYSDGRFFDVVCLNGVVLYYQVKEFTTTSVNNESVVILKSSTDSEKVVLN